jgi:hypothetical protein
MYPAADFADKQKFSMIHAIFKSLESDVLCGCDFFSVFILKGTLEI